MKKYLFISILMLFAATISSCTSESDNASNPIGSGNNGSGSSGGGNSGSSTSDYTFYKTVSALEVVEVSYKVSKTYSARINLYKHKNKVYMGHKSGSSMYYNLVSYNSHNDWGGVKVSSYSYMAIKLPNITTVSYIYFFNY